ncbi:MAG: 50S ribosomal protein L25/general stress protein Ctc [Eubacteriales bacterium]|nr:50S ribosomal protein L25/general stress protein Ctc [Eubacteriales bacterium]
MDIITVEKRENGAKAKQLRRAGIVPCCVYGGALPDSLSLQMDLGTAEKIFREKREGSKVKLKVGEEIIPAQIKELSRNILNNDIIHISFQGLKADQKVNSVAHVFLKNMDKVPGMLERMLMEIPFASLPKDMIDTVTVDLEDMPVGTIITVKDIPEFLDENIELQVDKESIVLRIHEQ